MPSRRKSDNADPLDNRPAYRRIDLYLIGIFIVGIAASALTFIMTMQGAGWTLPLIGTGKAAGGVTMSDSAGIWLYTSPTSQAYFSGIGGRYDTLLKPWRDYLGEQSPKGRETSNIADLRDLKTGVVILPSAAALTDEERQVLLDFQTRGGAILATWATGTRGANAQWAGWEFLEKISGVKYMGELPKEADASYLVLNGESPLGTTQDAGKSIWLGNNAERSLRLSAVGAGGQLADSSRAGGTLRTSESGVIFAESAPEAGRCVVFAFAESSWEHQPNDIRALVNDAVSWLKRRPVLLKSAWPEGKRAAQIIEMDTSEGFANAQILATQFKSANVPGAFYVTTSSATDFSDLLKALRNDFEVGYQGDTFAAFKDQSAAVQTQRITAMKTQWQKLTGDAKSLIGFRAPAESYDKTTEIALLKAGIKYHIAGPAVSLARLPFFAPIADTDIADGLLVFPRSQRDDANLLKQTDDAKTLSAALTSDFNQNKASGGLGVLSLSSKNFAENSPLKAAMPNYLSYVATQKNEVWLAQPSEVDRWWRDRERLRVNARPAGPRIEFDLSVGGKAPVQGGSLTLILPRKGVLPTITGLKTNMPVPTVKLMDDYRAKVVFDTLEPGDYFFQATF